MVPATVGADLDEVSRELGDLVGKGEQLAGVPSSAVGVCSEAVTERVGDLRQSGRAADRADVVTAVPVVARRADEISLGVTDIAAAQPARGQVGERCSSRQ